MRWRSVVARTALQAKPQLIHAWRELACDGNPCAVAH